MLAIGANDIAGGGTQASDAPARLRNLVNRLMQLATWQPTLNTAIDSRGCVR